MAVGSNGCQLRAELNPITDERGRRGAMKIELQHLANELKLPITVCHLPPGDAGCNLALRLVVQAA